MSDTPTDKSANEQPKQDTRKSAAKAVGIKGATLLKSAKLEKVDKSGCQKSDKAKENQRQSQGRGQKGCQTSDNLIKPVDTKKELVKSEHRFQCGTSDTPTYADLGIE